MAPSEYGRAWEKQDVQTAGSRGLCGATSQAEDGLYFAAVLHDESIFAVSGQMRESNKVVEALEAKM